MKHLNPTQIKIIDLLTQHSQLSGNYLGQVLMMSRTAVWKHVQLLIEAGVPISATPRQGYCLRTPITLLTQSRLHGAFQAHAIPLPPSIHLFSQIDSTNQFLKQFPHQEINSALQPDKPPLTHDESFTLLTLCCAETQTEGRGRFGRHWHSPFGENLYCSSLWHFNGDLSLLSGLSLVVSLAVVSLLSDLNLSHGIGIKWPNDVLWHEKKLCGSLIELMAESHGSVSIVIGVGLNVNSDTRQQPLPSCSWCSLYELAGHHFDRNLLAAQLIHKLQHNLNRFSREGMAAFMSEWEQWDYLKGKPVTVLSHSPTPLTGIAQGINERGQLLLTDESQVTHSLGSGEVSVRALPKKIPSSNSG